MSRYWINVQQQQQEVNHTLNVQYIDYHYPTLVKRLLKKFPSSVNTATTNTDAINELKKEIEKEREEEDSSNQEGDRKEKDFIRETSDRDVTQLLTPERVNQLAKLQLGIKENILTKSDNIISSSFHTPYSSSYSFLYRNNNFFAFRDYPENEIDEILENGTWFTNSEAKRQIKKQFEEHIEDVTTHLFTMQTCAICYQSGSLRNLMCCNTMVICQNCCNALLMRSTLKCPGCRTLITDASVVANLCNSKQKVKRIQKLGVK